MNSIRHNKFGGASIVPERRSGPHVLIGLSDHFDGNTRSQRARFAIIMKVSGRTAASGDARWIDRAKGRGGR
jgi:hypothetical protein